MQIMNIVAISVQESDAIQVLIKISESRHTLIIVHQWLIVIIGVVNNVALERCYDFCSDNIFTTILITSFILATFILLGFVLKTCFNNIFSETTTTFVLITLVISTFVLTTFDLTFF
jgi:hypothetical protein